MRFQLMGVHLSLPIKARRTRKALLRIGLVICGLAVSFIVCMLAGSQAAVSQVEAADVSFTKVVDTNTPIPNGIGNFTGFSPPSFDNGSVAFSGYGSGLSQQGIYTNIGSTLNVVADLNTPIPGGTGNFDSFSQPSISDGEVAFVGLGSAEPVMPKQDRVYDQRGIYTNVGGTLNVVADLNIPIPGGTGNFDSFSQPFISNESVTFIGNAPNFQGSGIYTNTGGVLTAIVDSNTPIPSETANFRGFSLISVSKDGNIAFASGKGIYTDINGVLNTVIDSNTLFPNSDINFDASRGLSIDNDGSVAFEGQNYTLLPSQYGIYTNVGGTLNVVADKNTLVPGSTGNFADFYDASISNGNIAFDAYGPRNSSLNALQGIYTTLGGALTKVIDTQYSLDDKTIQSLFLGSISGNQIAFLAQFSDQSAGIYIATFNPTSVQ